MVEGGDVDGDAWLSVRIPEGKPVHSVEITIYQPWGGLQVAPYQVWLGDAFGQQKFKCFTENPQREPSHGGIPAVSTCFNESTYNYVTILQLGEPRRWQIMELEVFSPEPRQDDSQWPNLEFGDVARAVADRFENGARKTDTCMPIRARKPPPTVAWRIHWPEWVFIACLGQVK